MKRGRKTTGDFVVLSPWWQGDATSSPAELTPEQAQVWADTLSAVPPDWLLPGAFPDVGLLQTRSSCGASRNGD